MFVFLDVIRQFKLTYLNNYVLSNGWELASLKDVQNTRNERSIKNHLYGQKSIVKIADGTLRYINRKLFISKFFIPDGKYMYHLLAKGNAFFISFAIEKLNKLI